MISEVPRWLVDPFASSSGTTGAPEKRKRRKKKDEGHWKTTSNKLLKDSKLLIISINIYQIEMPKTPKTSHSYQPLRSPVTTIQAQWHAKCENHTVFTFWPTSLFWVKCSFLKSLSWCFFPLNHSGQVPGISDTTFQNAAAPEMCTCPAEESLSNQPPVLLAHKDPNPGSRIVFLSQTFFVGAGVCNSIHIMSMSSHAAHQKSRGHFWQKKLVRIIVGVFANFAWPPKKNVCEVNTYVPVSWSKHRHVFVPKGWIP